MVLKRPILALFLGIALVSSCKPGDPDSRRTSLEAITQEAFSEGEVQSRGGFVHLEIGATNMDTIQAELGDVLTGYHLTIKVREGEECENPITVDRVGVFETPLFQEDVLTGCSYLIGLSLGLLAEGGESLEEAYYSNVSEDLIGWPVYEKDLVEGETIVVSEDLLKVGEAFGPLDPNGPIDQNVPLKLTREVIGFFLNTNPTPRSSIQSLKTRPLDNPATPEVDESASEYAAMTLDVLSPLWYFLDENGGVIFRDGGPLAEVFQLAKTQKFRIVPTVENLNSSPAALSNPAAIEALDQLAANADYAGLNIDFNGLLETDKPTFTDFIQKLAERLHKRRKVLMVSVAPNYIPGRSDYLAFDLEPLGRAADRIIIKTFDYCNVNTDAGPVMPYPEFDRNITWGLDGQVSSSKLVMAVPNYGYDWTVNNPGIMVSVDEVYNFAFNQSPLGEVNDPLFYVFDERHLEPNWNYPDLGRQIWLANEYTANQRFLNINQKNIRGTAIWFLGPERIPTTGFDANGVEIIEPTMWDQLLGLFKPAAMVK